jgi:hypothetical protein
MSRLADAGGEPAEPVEGMWIGTGMIHHERRDERGGR